MSEREICADITRIAGKATEAAYEGTARAIAVVIVSRDGTIETQASWQEGAYFALIAGCTFVQEKIVRYRDRREPESEL